MAGAGNGSVNISHMHSKTICTVGWKDNKNKSNVNNVRGSDVQNKQCKCKSTETECINESVMLVLWCEVQQGHILWDEALPEPAGVETVAPATSACGRRVKSPRFRWGASWRTLPPVQAVLMGNVFDSGQMDAGEPLSRFLFGFFKCSRGN